MNEKRMRLYIAAAQPVAVQNGWDCLIMLTHAYHESGGFDKVIGQNNFWGIKTPSKSNWTGLSKTVFTTEYESIVNGETEEQALVRISKKYGMSTGVKIELSTVYKGKWKVSLPQSFRDWSKPEEACRWYDNFIKTNYPEAYNSRADYQNFFKRLVDGKLKYATDPAYARSCENLYVQLKNNFK